MDPETGFDSLANVGISNGWITKITKHKIKGRETVDAKGLVVAPGFRRKFNGTAIMSGEPT